MRFTSRISTSQCEDERKSLLLFSMYSTSVLSMVASTDFSLCLHKELFLFVQQVCTVCLLCARYCAIF